MKVFPVLFLLVLLMACSEVREEFYDSGQLRERAVFENGLRNGEFKSYHENGQLAGEGQFVDDVMTGNWKLWYENGKTLSVSSYDEKGKLINFNAWDESGKQIVVDGTGVTISRYPNGKPMSQMGYKNNKFDGQFLTWAEDGTLLSEFFYEEGKPVGLWKQWDPDGTLRRTEQQGSIRIER